MMKPTQATRRTSDQRAAIAIPVCAAVLSSAFPAQAAATGGASASWLSVLLALLVGTVLGGLARESRARRERARLAKQLEECDASLRQREVQLLAARRDHEALSECLHRQSQEFERQAHEDGLTGLPNGRAFDEGFAHHFSRAKRHGQSLCLMLLDLDHFRDINNNWSHAVGDEVLVEAARLLRSVCRTSDLPARLGGDGFAVILTDTDLEGGKRFSQRLHAAFAACRGWYSGEVGPNYVSTSAGLVQLGEQDQAPLQLRQRADHALYLAKHAGGARTSLG